MDYENLNYPGFDDDVTKNISYSHNVRFTGDLANKRLKIDKNLSLLDNKVESRAVLFLRRFISHKRNDRNPYGSFFLYVHDPKSGKRAYDAMDRMRLFLTAVRIYTGKNADSYFDFSIKSSKKGEYYLPFDLRTNGYDPDESRNHSVLDNKKDFNIIKKIHKRLGEAGIEKTIHYSKLYNAVKFFNHAYDQRWTLLKTTLLFTSLESLFSDSSKSEVTEKIAIRTAYLLYPKNSSKRKEIYTFIKRGYEIRSAFVHGSDTDAEENRTMKKFEKEKGAGYYGFHHHFIEDLRIVVGDCLKRSILDDVMYSFFSKEKYKDQEEREFYCNLVL